MQLVYSFQVHKTNNKELFKYFEEQCLYSANLYNQTSILLKKGMETKEYENICSLDKKLKELNENNFYRKLEKAQVAQQTIKLAQKSWQTFFKGLKTYFKNKSKFRGKPKEPKEVKNYPLVFTNQCSKIKEGRIYLSKKVNFYIPQYETYKERISKYQQIRIVPKGSFFNVEIIYNVDNEINDFLNENKFASIDLGVNNLCTLFLENEHPELISGRKIKSINHFYNKSKAKLKKKQNNKDLFKKKLNKLYSHRENFIKDHFHKISKYIVNRLLSYKIGTLVIGYNQGWKDSINIGRKNNQKFTCIPYFKLISFLKYKCEMIGINLQINEEAYTSKCDSMSFEEVKKHDVYSGRRVKRGLFQSSIGKLLNADVNGALNIL